MVGSFKSIGATMHGIAQRVTQIRLADRLDAEADAALAAAAVALDEGDMARARAALADAEDLGARRDAAIQDADTFPQIGNPLSSIAAAIRAGLDPAGPSGG